MESPELGQGERPSFVLAVALLAGTFLYLFASSGNPLVTRGEGREALVVQAMYNQNNLVLPLRNGISIPSKPPLFHWLGYGGSLVFGGIGEKVLRFPSLLSSALTVTIFYILFSRRMNRLTALFSVLIMFTTLDFLRASTAARVDMLFTLWASLSTWLLFEAGEQRFKLTLCVAIGACLGLAALTKGPAGIALPISVASVYWLVSRPWRSFPIVLLAISGIIAVAVAFPWYLAAYYEGGQRFLDVHLMRENVARIIGMKDYEVGHESSRIGIIGMILSGLLPWSIFIPYVVVRFWRQRAELRKGDPALLFCVIWAVFYLVFFSLTASRRNVYLLPSYPAYAYILGTMVAASVRTDVIFSPRMLLITGWLCRAFAATLVIAACAIGLGRFIDPAPLLQRFDVNAGTMDVATSLRMVGLRSILLLLGICAGFFLAGTRLLSGQIRLVVCYLIAAQLALGYVVHTGIMSEVSVSQSPKAELPQLLQNVAEGAPLYQFRHDFYAIDFYANRIIETVDAKPNVDGDGAAYILVSESDLADARAKIEAAEIVAVSDRPIVDGKSKLVILRFT